MVLLGLAVFVSAALLDAAEAFYVRSVGEQKPWWAAFYSVTMYVIGCVGFFAVLKVSWWLMVPEVLGLMLGSVIAVKYSQRHVKKSCT